MVHVEEIGGESRVEKAWKSILEVPSDSAIDFTTWWSNHVGTEVVSWDWVVDLISGEVLWTYADLGSKVRMVGETIILDDGLVPNEDYNEFHLVFSDETTLVLAFIRGNKIRTIIYRDQG